MRRCMFAASKSLRCAGVGATVRGPHKIIDNMTLESLHFIPLWDITYPIMELHYVTPNTTALRIAYMLSQAGLKKARLSGKTLKLLSDRDRTRVAFVNSVKLCLEDLGYGMIELARGGFAVFESSFLEGVPAITARKYLPRSERETLTDDDLYAEIAVLDLSESDDE